VINVIVPVQRVQLVPPTDTIHAGEQAILRARAFARSGQPIDGVPVDVKLIPQNSVSSAESDGRVYILFPTAGSQMVVASFRGKADTVVIKVAPARKQ